MKWKSIKSERDVNLKGITASFEFEDKQIRSVTLRDGEGNQAKFSYESYSFKAMVPAPPEKVTRWQVSGEYLGLTPVNRLFESYREASDWLDKLNKAADDYDGSKSPGLQVREVEIEESELVAA